jgi:hypothetical protein
LTFVDGHRDLVGLVFSQRHPRSPKHPDHSP